MGNPRNIDDLLSKEDRRMYMNPDNAHGTLEDIFGSEESRITIEGKYQHVINYDKLMEKIIEMHFLF